MKYIYIHEDGRVVRSSDLKDLSAFADGFGVTVIDTVNMTEKCGDRWDPIPTVHSSEEEFERRSKRTWTEIDKMTKEASSGVQKKR